jgi:hypothetical protein
VPWAIPYLSILTRASHQLNTDTPYLYRLKKY